MEGDSGNRFDGFGFGSIYGTRSGEFIRSFKTKGDVSHVSFGLVERNLTSLRYQVWVKAEKFRKPCVVGVCVR